MCFLGSQASQHMTYSVELIVHVLCILGHGVTRFKIEDNDKEEESFYTPFLHIKITTNKFLEKAEFVFSILSSIFLSNYSTPSTSLTQMFKILSLIKASTMVPKKGLWYLPKVFHDPKLPVFLLP